MSLLALDHLIVAADSLAQGAAWCEATLGVAPGPGGRHPLMGTHNRLLKLTTARYPNAYLEIIAVDPDAAPPGRARWFGLDDPGLRASLRECPRLIHAVARSTRLDVHRCGLLNLGHQPGEPVRASRQTPQGLLSWQIVVRPDGELECAGALPTLIQWDGAHPAETMPDAGVTLQGLTLAGLSPRVCEMLRMPGVECAPAGGPALRAALQTPRGAVTLSS